MERATVMKTLHGNLIPKSPTMRDASFSSYLRPDKPITCQPHHRHHDAIGSTRCRDFDDSTTELSIFDAHKYFNSEVITMSPSGSSSNSRVSPLANTDTETNIAAEKGGDNIIGNTITRYSSASTSVDGGGYASIRNYRARSFHGAATPTASSEASWNSRVGLLSHPNDAGAIPASMRDPSNTNELNKKLKASLSKPIWILRRKCPCTGKKSVQVKENTPPPPPQPKTQVSKPQQQQPQQQQPLKDHSLTLKTHDHDAKSTIMNTMMDTAALKNPKNVPIIAPNNNWVVDKVATIASPTFITTKSNSQRFHLHRVVASSPVRVPFSDGFTFPVLNPHASAPTATRRAQNGVVSSEDEDQPPRDSLEVFQPPNDAVEPTSDSPKPRTAGEGDDDAASDASSDLFEIESFSAGGAEQSTCPVVLRRAGGNSVESGNGFFYGGGRRRSMDEGSTATTAAMMECYEPSEASVEWSVTTAEGFYEESVVDGGGSGGGGGRGGDVAAAAGAREKWRRKVGSSGNGGLLLAGCRCEKAVSVGPQPVRKQCGGSGEGHRGSTSGSRHVNVSVIVNSGGGGNRVGLRSCNKPPLPLARPHNNSNNTTPPMSLAFAT